MTDPSGASPPDCLVVMAKAPRAGLVKTRLSPPLAPGDAAALYRCFLKDRLREVKACRWVGKTVAFTPESEKAFFQREVPAGFELLLQEGESLSQRVSGIFTRLFARRHRAVVVTDSDSPDLPAALLDESFRALTGGADVVFGPCLDGGYYLVGMKEEIPGFFEGIPWSTSKVLDESLGRASRLGLSVVLLAPWQDIDTGEDLRAFYHRFRERGRTAAAGMSTFSRLEEMVAAGSFEPD